MLALTDWPLAARALIGGVFTDIDDTLTTDGNITPDALAALGALTAAGLIVVAITGRSVGWSARLAHAWPVDAVVAENGAVLLQFKHQTGATPLKILPDQLSKSYCLDAATRRANLA